MSTEEKNKKRGLLATIVYHVLLVLLFVFVGLTYQDPPPEDGIAINFGYEDDGSGNTTQSAPQQTQPQTTEAVEEEVATQEMVDAPTVNTDKPKEKPVEKPKEEPKEEPKPKPDPRLQGALDKTKNQEGQGQGEGETTGGGDQGREDGDKNSPNREGGGSGFGDGVLGDGRKPVFKPNISSECGEGGRVIVKVYVDNSGKVTRAYPGEGSVEGKKTNTTSSCLLRVAKEVALKTRWQSTDQSKPVQFGYIMVNFNQ